MPHAQITVLSFFTTSPAQTRSSGRRTLAAAADPENTSKVVRHDLSAIPVSAAVLTRINTATFDYLPAAGPAHWNAMRITLLSNGNSVPSIDNLIPNGTTIRCTGVRRQDNQLLITWRGGLGPYQIQQSPDLTLGSWTNLSTPLTVTTTSLPIDATRRFFRVTHPPP